MFANATTVPAFCPHPIDDLVKQQPQAIAAFIHNRVFRTDAFIRTKDTVGARSAQFRWRYAKVLKTLYVAQRIGADYAATGTSARPAAAILSACCGSGCSCPDRKSTRLNSS